MEFLVRKKVLGKILFKELIKIVDVQGQVLYGFDKCYFNLKRYFCVFLLVGKQLDVELVLGKIVIFNLVDQELVFGE